MKLNIFKEIIGEFKGDNKEVLINLSEASVGVQAFADISYISEGFDWELNQIRIEPSKPLITKNKDRDLIIPKVKDPLFPRRYVCRACGNYVEKEDNYCRTCGQCIKEEI